MTRGSRDRSRDRDRSRERDGSRDWRKNTRSDSREKSYSLKKDVGFTRNEDISFVTKKQRREDYSELNEK